MKKSLVILLLILSTLSIAYAVYENQKAENCNLRASKKEIILNEKIRQLEDSLQQISRQHEIERRRAMKARQIAENLSMQVDEGLKQAN